MADGVCSSARKGPFSMLYTSYLRVAYCVHVYMRTLPCAMVVKQTTPSPHGGIERERITTNGPVILSRLTCLAVDSIRDGVKKGHLQGSTRGVGLDECATVHLPEQECTWRSPRDD